MKGGRRFVEVALPLPLSPTYTYELPQKFRDEVACGSRVLVPFGRKLTTGYVVDFVSQPQFPLEKIKKVSELLDEKPLIAEFMLRLTKWAADYYLTSWGEFIKACLPAGINIESHTVVSISDAGLRWAEKLASSEEKLPHRFRVLKHLQSEPALPVKRLKRLFPSSSFYSSLSWLHKEGFITLREKLSGRASPARRRAEKEPFEEALPGSEKPIELTPLQQEVYSRIVQEMDKGSFSTILLHGVTGSGKTEIYIMAVKKVLAEGKSALILVPEIGLTPQLSRRFGSCLGNTVAVLHSGLGRGERLDEWWRVKRGEAKVVMGTRSAVFAPLQNIGIIIVDEEHDASYKQEESPRYNGRDVAIVRAKMQEVVVLLGSATPSLESYYKAQQGKYLYLSLPTRVSNRQLAEAEIVDMKEELKREGGTFLLSEKLLNAIKERLARKEQVMLLINRRGYASFLLCRSCAYTPLCPHCSLALTFHQRPKRLMCHYCGYSRLSPVQCPQCQGEYLHMVGEGSEKFEEVLKVMLPEEAICRMDRDTTRRKGSYEKILTALAEESIRILVGTQMIAKGHDYPKVTLVGVVASDTALCLPDFRSSERNFQLLTQVAGRAGRGDIPGKVIIQTYYPDHYSISFACQQDYDSFYKQELKFRKWMKYPPFTSIINLVVKGRDRERVKKKAELLAQQLREHRDSSLIIMGPAPAPLARIKGEYRYQLILKGRVRTRMKRCLQQSLEALSSKRISTKNLQIDVDPMSMM